MLSLASEMHHEHDILLPIRQLNRNTWLRIAADQQSTLLEFERLEASCQPTQKLINASEDTLLEAASKEFKTSCLARSPTADGHSINHSQTSLPVPIFSPSRYSGDIVDTFSSLQLKTIMDFNDKSDQKENLAQIQSLSADLSRMKALNSKLKRERESSEKKGRTIRSEQVLVCNQDEFDQYRKTEMQKVKDQHTEQLKQLKRERKLWESQRKAFDILPTKKERQEMEVLRNELKDQLEVHKMKESRSHLAQERLRRKLDEMELRNRELRGEVKVLEQQRAKYMDRNQKPLIPKTFMAQKDELKPFEIVSSMEKKSSAVETLGPRHDPVTSDLDQLQLELELPVHEEVIQAHKEFTYSDGKKERIYADGTHLIWHLNGSMKCSKADSSETIYFNNGDSKTVFPSGQIAYWYHEPRTKHTTYPDGLQFYEFESGQTEKHYPDGLREIMFADKTLKYILPDGQEEVVFPDGKVQRIDETGNRMVSFPDGTKETHQDGVKTKTYTNGMVKCVRSDGSQETRWPNGQVRFKNSQGVVTH